MPFVRIELPDNRNPEQVRQIADAIHEARVATIDIPAEDRFQLISQRPPEARIFDRGYLGVFRTDDCIFCPDHPEIGSYPGPEARALPADCLQCVRLQRCTSGRRNDHAHGNGGC